MSRVGARAAGVASISRFQIAGGPTGACTNVGGPSCSALCGTIVQPASRATRAEGQSPRYYACYDLTSTQVFDSPAWLAVRATDWSSRVRPAFRNTRRTMFHREALA